MTFKQWNELGLETEKQQRTFPRAKHSTQHQKGHPSRCFVCGGGKSRARHTARRLKRTTELLDRAYSWRKKHTLYDGRLRGGHTTQGGRAKVGSLKTWGITNDSEIITYCGSVGTLSGLTYYALKLAGFKNVKLYPKSFKEWKALGKPKEEFKDAPIGTFPQNETICLKMEQEEEEN